jgi:very-short-patch-repair endonuclease
VKRVRFARRLRQNMTDAETRLWQKLRGRRFRGYKFRRQMPIEGYIADFACVEAKLIIEVDGGQHGIKVETDDTRSATIATAGYLVIRFWNSEVLTNTEGVLDEIAIQLALRIPAGSKHD